MTWKHGESGYRNYNCRCAICRKANTARQMEKRSLRALRLAADPTIVKHGTHNIYTNWECRCSACAQAHAKYVRTNYRKRRRGLEFGREWLSA